MRVTKVLIVIISLLGSCCALAQQNARKARYMKDAAVQHSGLTATVFANDPRPLLQATRAIAAEYGWVVDFEDPLYFSKFDTVDATDPAWRAANPSSKGTLNVAGGAFQSTFPEPSSSASSVAAEVALQKVVEDYNASGNPGKFVVSKEAGRRFTITGLEVKDESGFSKPVPALLDTVITIPLETRNGEEMFDLFLQTLSDTAHTKVVHGSFMTNLLRNSTVAAGGNGVTARSVLSSIVSQLDSQYQLNWTLFYDLDSGMYFLNIWPAMTSLGKGPNGNPNFAPLKRDDTAPVPH